MFISDRFILWYAHFSIYIEIHSLLIFKVQTSTGHQRAIAFQSWMGWPEVWFTGNIEWKESHDYFSWTKGCKSPELERRKCWGLSFSLNFRWLRSGSLQLLLRWDNWMWDDPLLRVRSSDMLSRILFSAIAVCPCYIVNFSASFCNSYL